MKPNLLLPLFLTVALNVFSKTPNVSAQPVNNSYILYIIILLVILGGLCIVVYVMFKKNPEIEDSSSDPLWNNKFLHDYSDDVFYLMQDAWKLRDLSPVKHLMTDELIQAYDAHFERMKTQGEVNKIKLIEIHEIQIIPDHSGNEDLHQSYTAIIDGSMVDAGFNEFTGEAIYNGDLELDYFRDFYHFVRVEERWLLEFIDKKSLVHKVIGEKFTSRKNEKHK